MSMTKISLMVLSLAQILSDEANHRPYIALWFGIAAAYSGSTYAVCHTSAVVPETALVFRLMSLGQEWQVVWKGPTS